MEISEYRVTNIMIRIIETYEVQLLIWPGVTVEMLVSLVQGRRPEVCRTRRG